MRKIVVAMSIVMALAVGCKGNNKKSEEKNDTIEQVTETTQSIDVTGSYVSEDYEKRSEGYDWVGVTVTSKGADKINVSIRSRADIKKPTCTFDAEADKVNDITYKADLGDAVVLFSFNENVLTIAPENADNANALFFYCSGGATIAGTYNKIDGTLDASQVDKSEAKSE